MTFEEMRELGAHELNDREKFARQGMEAISFAEHPLGRFCQNTLFKLGSLLEFLQSESRRLNRAISSDLLDQMERDLALVKKIQLVIVPAAYALDGDAHQGQIDVIERYISTCLGIPLTKAINTHVKQTDAGFGRENWQRSTFVWEALHQGRWINKDNPEAYIVSTSEQLFKQLEAQAENEHIRAAKHNCEVVTEADTLNVGESTVSGDAAIENFVEYGNIRLDTSERARSLLTEQLAHCAAMLDAGACVADVAEYLNVAPKHVGQTVRRMRQKADLMDKSEPISFDAELAGILARILHKNNGGKGECGQVGYERRTLSTELGRIKNP